jgi:hypothetical protein
VWSHLQKYYPPTAAANYWKRPTFLVIWRKQTNAWQKTADARRTCDDLTVVGSARALPSLPAAANISALAFLRSSRRIAWLPTGCYLVAS